MSKCIECKKVIIKSRLGIKYCSTNCKQKAYYKRKREFSVQQSSQNGKYDYQDFLKVKSMINEKLFIDYLVYCFLKSTAPKLNSLEEEADYMTAILEEFHEIDDDYATDVYFNPMKKFIKKFFESGW